MDTLGREGELSVHALGKWRISTGKYHGDCSYEWSVVFRILQHTGGQAPIEVVDLCVIHVGFRHDE